jgi:hypothetical protein
MVPTMGKVELAHNAGAGRAADGDGTYVAETEAMGVGSSEVAVGLKPMGTPMLGSKASTSATATAGEATQSPNNSRAVPARIEKRKAITFPVICREGVKKNRAREAN